MKGLKLSQLKVDQVVLWKLFRHAESGGEALTPEDLQHHFSVAIPQRRIELALEQLESDRLVKKEYHPHYTEGLWTITRAGLTRVERAIRSSATFLGRLNENGEAWLFTEEAEKALLKKLPDSKPSAVEEGPATFAGSNSPAHGITIQNNFSPNALNNNLVGTIGDDGLSRSATMAGWFGGWGAWVSAIIALATLIWILHEAKVF